MKKIFWSVIIIIVFLTIVIFLNQDKGVIGGVEIAEIDKIVPVKPEYDSACVELLEYASNNKVNIEQWEALKKCQKKLIIDPLKSKEYVINIMKHKSINPLGEVEYKFTPIDVIKYHKQMAYDIETMELSNGAKLLKESTYDEINTKFNNIKK